MATDRDDDDGDDELEEGGGESAEKHDEEAEQLDDLQVWHGAHGHRERLETAFPECTAVQRSTTHARAVQQRIPDNIISLTR